MIGTETSITAITSVWNQLIMAFANGLKRRMWNHLAARAALSRQQRALFPIALGRLYSRGRTRAWNAWVCATSGRQREQRRLWNACLEWQRRGMRRPWFHLRYVSRCPLCRALRA
jgi:hypothetical protein